MFEKGAIFNVFQYFIFPLSIRALPAPSVKSRNKTFLSVAMETEEVRRPLSQNEHDFL